jgi:ElaB/YqjD/DUF883 family membrane-anchored ribosome-binding protein
MAVWEAAQAFLRDTDARRPADCASPSAISPYASAHTPKKICHTLKPKFESAGLFVFSMFTEENAMKVTTRGNTPFLTGSGEADATLNKVASSVHGAVDMMAGAADDALRKVNPAIDHAAQIAHQAVNKVAEVAGPPVGWLSEQRDSLQATRRKVAADTGQYVSAHPWKSLGFALATGFIISRLIR